MNTNTVKAVDAIFGGEAVRFELQRDEIRFLETGLGGSAYECLNRLVGGRWTVTDLLLVLSAAVPASYAGGNDLSAGRRAMAKALGPHIASNVQAGEHAAVQRVLTENPPARYAVLAMKILEAALFGIAPDIANFDEDAVEEPA